MSKPISGEVDGSSHESLCIGTWNVSWWTHQRLTPIASLHLHLLALQETKLGPLPLENVRSSLRRQQYTLHHGAAAAARTVGGYGDSAGVGLLAMPGVAVSPLPPQCAAWRRLHAMARLHGVFFPRRPGLPLGLRVFSIYAPLQRGPQREAFNGAFVDFVSGLDMQIPTLLLGDFNGSVAPERDFTSRDGQVCPLLCRLLGPGGPFIDLLMAISPEEWAYTFAMPYLGSLKQSRCDLALGNRAVLNLIQRVRVVSAITEGGHSPVVIELRPVSSSWILSWRAPKPRLPALLQLAGEELC